MYCIKQPLTTHLKVLFTLVSAKFMKIYNEAFETIFHFLLLRTYVTQDCEGNLRGES